jgi:hypothetical protein
MITDVFRGSNCEDMNPMLVLFILFLLDGSASGNQKGQELLTLLCILNLEKCLFVVLLFDECGDGLIGLICCVE